MDLISVIIPTLNERKNIGNILKDLENQSYKKIEVIVVDRNSKDRTLSIVKKFKNIKTFSTNIKLAKQRNLGGFKAKGKYLFFLDADVRINKHFIKNCINSLSIKKLDIACPIYYPYKSSFHIIIFYFICNLIFILVQKFSASGAGSCIIIKRQIFIINKGFRHKYKFDDIEFIRRVSKKHKFGILTHFTYVSPRRFEKYGFINVVLSYIRLSYFFITEKFYEANKIKYKFGEY